MLKYKRKIDMGNNKDMIINYINLYKLVLVKTIEKINIFKYN